MLVKYMGLKIEDIFTEPILIFVLVGVFYNSAWMIAALLIIFLFLHCPYSYSLQTVRRKTIKPLSHGETKTSHETKKCTTWQLAIYTLDPVS